MLSAGVSSRRLLAVGLAAAAVGAVVVSRSVGWRRLFAALVGAGPAGVGSASASGAGAGAGAGAASGSQPVLGPRRLHLLVASTGDAGSAAPLLTAIRHSVDPSRVIPSVRRLQQLEEEPWEAHALALVLLAAEPASGALPASLTGRVAAYLAGGGQVLVTGA